MINIVEDEKNLVRYSYDQNTLSSNTVKYITELKKGEITIVTDKGIDIINKNENKIIINKFSEELNADGYLEIQKIICDNKGYHWIATKQGIIRVDINNEIKIGREFCVP